MTAAFDQHESGDTEAHLHWVSALLEWYYDPMYDYQLTRKAERVVYRGDASAVRDFLEAQSG
jgi:tRNA 2-selenouridine synthase